MEKLISYTFSKLKQKLNDFDFEFILEENV